MEPRGQRGQRSAVRKPRGQLQDRLTKTRADLHEHLSVRSGDRGDSRQCGAPYPCPPLFRGGRGAAGTAQRESEGPRVSTDDVAEIADLLDRLHVDVWVGYRLTQEIIEDETGRVVGKQRVLQAQQLRRDRRASR